MPASMAFGNTMGLDGGFHLPEAGIAFQIGRKIQHLRLITLRLTPSSLANLVFKFPAHYKCIGLHFAPSSWPYAFHYKGAMWAATNSLGCWIISNIRQQHSNNTCSVCLALYLLLWCPTKYFRRSGSLENNWFNHESSWINAARHTTQAR